MKKDGAIDCLIDTIKKYHKATLARIAVSIDMECKLDAHDKKLSHTDGRQNKLLENPVETLEEMRRLKELIVTWEGNCSKLVDEKRCRLLVFRNLRLRCNVYSVSLRSQRVKACA